MDASTLTELGMPTLGHNSNSMQGASMDGLMSHILLGLSMQLGGHLCNVHFSIFTLDPSLFHLIFDFSYQSRPLHILMRFDHAGGYTNLIRH